MELSGLQIGSKKKEVLRNNCNYPQQIQGYKPRAMDILIESHTDGGLDEAAACDT